MMFLVIFGSLAAAMAIVAQGNLATADSHLRVNRALAAAETGLHFVTYRLNQATFQVRTRDGVISAENAPDLWDETRALLLEQFEADIHNLEDPVEAGDTLSIGPISVGPGAPAFTASFTPHPILGENYASAYYQRSPYSQMNPAVSANNPLDATWVRVRVTAADGSITRSIQMDFKIDKKIRFAILSKSRVMIGRNVMIEGPIGSRFTDTDLEHGHPVQMRSDFKGLDDDLDDQLDELTNTLISNDMDGDNRLHLADTRETEGIDDPGQFDTNEDGYVDEYDFFLDHFDANADGAISELELGVDDNVSAEQLMELIDTFGDPDRPGYGDGQIDEYDNYAKIRGSVKLTADMEGWSEGAAGGAYQDYFAGPIHPGHNDDPLTFEAGDASVHEFTPTDFDTATFQELATGDFESQVQQQAAEHDPNDPESPEAGDPIREQVPFGAAHPYDYYDRPVYRNMTFTNVTIPKGTNALFENCTFVGVTFVDTTEHNDDPNFNYAGMQEADGALKHDGLSAVVDGETVADTKGVSNNVRFHDCTFEGAVVANATENYTHVRNKIAFTGRTQFPIDESDELSDEEKLLYKRSAILAPHYSVELGTFVSPADSNETLHLSGAIVAGVLDMRGQVEVTGTILTTFEPHTDVGPVVGETSPQFNTTLGYFNSDAGDLEAEEPANGVGVIQVRYDPTLPLPDGILGPIEIRPVVGTYFEGGAY